MGETTRREKIEAMLAETPDDVFLQYSLAMELQKEGAHEESLRRFRELQERQPPYIPAFFMAAKLLLQLQQVEAARTSGRRDGPEDEPQRRGIGRKPVFGETVPCLGRSPGRRSTKAQARFLPEFPDRGDGERLGRGAGVSGRETRTAGFSKRGG